MNKFFKLATAAFMAVFFANNSIADNEGFSIGIWGSSLDIDTYGTESQGPEFSETEADVVSNTQSRSVDVGSVFIEYTSAQGSSIGFEFYPGEATIGSGKRTDTSNDADADATATHVYSAEADVNNVATVYAEPTYMVNDIFGVYGKVGLTTMHVISLESNTFGTDSTTYPNTDVWGAMWGLGLKARHSSGLFLKLERAVTNFRPIHVEGTGGNANAVIDGEIDLDAVRLALGYTF